MFKYKKYNSYDSSLKLFINCGGDTDAAKILNVPSSTIHNWKIADYSTIIGREANLHSLNDYNLYKKFIKSKKAKLIFKHCFNISECFHSIINKLPKPKSIYENNKAIIIETVNKFKNILKIEKILKLFKISFQQYSIWINDRLCPISLENKCRKTYPNQLLNSEIKTIKNLLTDTKYQFWNKISIYYHGIRNNSISCCLPTFYKYSNLLGINRKQPKNKRKNHVIGYRASIANETWHADVTPFKTLDNQNHYIYLVMDNYSRFILSWDVSTNLSASIRMKTFKDAYQKYSFLKPNHFIDLVVDGGPENKKDVDIFIKDPSIFLKKLIAQTKEFIFSNSMVEASNKMLKYQYLFRKDLLNGDELKKHLKFSIHDHNYNKPYGPLKGLIPYEAFFSIPRNLLYVKDQIYLAIQDRIINNQNIDCNQLCLQT